MIVISHDREFLDSVPTSRLHLTTRDSIATAATTASSRYARAADRAAAERTTRSSRRRIAHLQSFIDRFKAKATKATAGAKPRQGTRKDGTDRAGARVVAVHVRIPRADAAPNPMLVVDDVRCGYHTESGDVPIVENVTYRFRRTSASACWARTARASRRFVKTTRRHARALCGHRAPGQGPAHRLFRAAAARNAASGDDSPSRRLARDVAPATREQELRDFLGGFHFTGEMVTATIGRFPAARRRASSLALIVWQRPNLLLLDEPTNHLDLETRDALTHGAHAVRRHAACWCRTTAPCCAR